MTILQIVIPILPPKELSPNYWGHWTQRHRATTEFKGFTRVCIPYQVVGDYPLFPKAELSVTFIIPNRRHYRDPDNAFACLKPAIDACVDAGVLQDDDPQHLLLKSPIEWQINKEKAPMTILEFKEVE